ncbi:MAG: serpin family protein, partial [Anaerolineaceae bacterium]|nr:serpin family protein [Anaerolineaceae bacterium]
MPRPPLDEIQSAFSSKERQSMVSDPAGYSPVAEQMNAFGLDFFHLLSAQQEGNLFFSPYSISLALSMTLAGAAGNTEQEMAQV